MAKTPKIPNPLKPDPKSFQFGKGLQNAARTFGSDSGGGGGDFSALAKAAGERANKAFSDKTKKKYEADRLARKTKAGKSVENKVEDVIINTLNDPTGPIAVANKEVLRRLNNIDINVKIIRSDTKYIRKKFDKELSSLKAALQNSTAVGGGGTPFFNAAKGAATVAGGWGAMAAANKITGGRVFDSLVKSGSFYGKFLGKLSKLAKGSWIAGVILEKLSDPVFAWWHGAPEQVVRKEIVGAIAGILGTFGAASLGAGIGAAGGAMVFGVGSIPGAAVGWLVGAFAGYMGGNWAEGLAEFIFDCVMGEKQLDEELKAYLKKLMMPNGPRSRYRYPKNRGQPTSPPAQAGKAKPKPAAPGIRNQTDPVQPRVRPRQGPQNRVPSVIDTYEANPYLGITNSGPRTRGGARGRRASGGYTMPPMNFVRPSAKYATPLPMAKPSNLPNQEKVNRFKNKIKKNPNPTGVPRPDYTPIGYSQPKNVSKTRAYAKGHMFYDGTTPSYQRDYFGNLNPTLQGTPFRRIFNGIESGMGSYLVDQRWDQMPSTYGGRYGKGGGMGGGMGNIPGGGFGKNGAGSWDDTPKNKTKAPLLTPAAKATIDSLTSGQKVYNSSFLNQLSSEELESLGINKTTITSPENRGRTATEYSISEPKISQQDILNNLTGSTYAATKDAGDFQKEIATQANRLGVSPQDLATVMSYETGGSLNPDKWGGKGGNYMGLIQFGPDERKTYGITEGMSQAEQMVKVGDFLEDRGLSKWLKNNPDASVQDKQTALYSTINAGSPGREHWHKSDGNNTVMGHAENMFSSDSRHVTKAQSLLDGQVVATGDGPNRTRTYQVARERAMQAAKAKQARTLSEVLARKGGYSTGAQDFTRVGGGGTMVSPIEGKTTAELASIQSKVGETRAGKRRGFLADRGFRSGDDRLHAGIDVMQPAGTKARSTEGGKVIRAQSQSGYNGTVDVLHTAPDGTKYVTRYAHLDAGSLNVKVGDDIPAGTVLGALDGDNHLHFEVRDYEKYKVNPFSRVRAGDNAETAASKGLYDPSDYLAGRGKFSHLAPKSPESISPSGVDMDSDLPQANKVNVLFAPTGGDFQGTVRQVAEKLQAKGEKVIMVGDNDEEQAVALEQVKALGPNAKINLSGYSKGGMRAIAFSNRLDEVGMKVDQMELVDPGQGIDGTHAPGLTNADVIMGGGIRENVKSVVIHKPSYGSVTLPYGDFLANGNKTTKMDTNVVGTPFGHMSIMGEKKVQSGIVDRFTESDRPQTTPTPTPRPKDVASKIEPPVVEQQERVLDQPKRIKDEEMGTSSPQSRSTRAEAPIPSGPEYTAIGKGQEPATTSQSRYNQINRNKPAEYQKNPAGIENTPTWNV